MPIKNEPWRIFRGTGKPHEAKIPAPPPWRRFHGKPHPRQLNEVRMTADFKIDEQEAERINAALLLRRPLLVTGKPGIGKSTLATAVAHELVLGEVLVWPINSRSTLQDGLYRYDAIGRLQDAKFHDSHHVLPTANIGRYIKLGPLGSAFLPSARPRVLLIDEIDKSDIDLPNDLLNIFEQGRFEIPELSRLPPGEDVVDVQPWDGNDPIPIHRGQVEVAEFPFVLMTSNGERDFPGPFLRRCIPLEMQPPGAEKLAEIVAAHLGPEAVRGTESLIEKFLSRVQAGEDLATDQLLNAVFLRKAHDLRLEDEKRKVLRDAILHALNVG